jgi:hypothetical protein
LPEAGGATEGGGIPTLDGGTDGGGMDADASPGGDDATGIADTQTQTDAPIDTGATNAEGGTGMGRLAQRPYLGWSSWSFFHNKVISEQIIRAEADAMAASLLSAGYQYVNIDAGWSGGYDNYGRPQAGSNFPSGIAALAAYVHGKGLKLGIYLNPGLDQGIWSANLPIFGTQYHAKDIVSNTAIPGNTLGAGTYKIDYTKPGAAEYIQSCADLLASWGVDFIKMDFVGPGGGHVQADNRDDIQNWREALDHTGRPIWLELSNSLSLMYASFWKTYANGWRITGDIENYHGTGLTIWTRVSTRFTAAPAWAQFAGPGAWMDFDSLELGAGAGDGLTPDERQTTMTLWAISCVPLFVGADLTTLDPGDLMLLTNAEVLAIDQAGHVATPVSQANGQQVWRVANGDGSYTVALFNLDAVQASVTVQWSDLGLSGAAQVHDAWTHTDVGSLTGSFSAMLPSHGSRLLTIHP